MAIVAPGVWGVFVYFVLSVAMVQGLVALGAIATCLSALAEGMKAEASIKKAIAVDTIAMKAWRHSEPEDQ